MNTTTENDNVREGTGHPAPQGAGDGTEPGREGDGNELATFQPGAGTSLATAFESSLARLISGDATEDDFLSVVNVEKRFSEIVTAIKKLAGQAKIAFLDRHGEVVCGEVRYYNGVERKTRCVDQAAVAEAILNATGGDLGKLNDCLASGAFKPGATSQVLDEATYSRLFKTEEVPDMKTGKPRRVTHAVNQNFLRKGK